MLYKQKIINSLMIIIPVLCGIIISIILLKTLVWWMDRVPYTESLTMSVPGLDKVPVGARDQKDHVEIGRFFKKFDVSCDNSFKGQWSGFRGNDFSNISSDSVKLAEKWQESGPPVLWKIKLGEGHAGPAIRKCKVYILDYLEDERADALRCFCALTGKELWRRWYLVDTKRNHGRSRTVPAVSEDSVVTIGPKGHVMCVDAETGVFKWGIDLVKEFGSEIPQWYTGQCPLIFDSTAVLAPCGPKALLVGVDIQTGRILWETTNSHQWKMSHSSVMLITINGKKMYVYFALGGIIGVAADGKKVGTILFESDSFAPAVVAPSPVILDDNRIYLTAGYGAGSTIVQINKLSDKFVVQKGKQYKPRDALSIEQQSALYYKNMLFGIMPKDAGIRRQQLTACRSDDISQFITPLDNNMRFGLGPFIIADEKFYVLDDDGTLSMLRFDGKIFTLLSRYKVLNGHDAWGPIAVSEGLMFLRDSTSMVCLDLTKDKRSYTRNGG